MRLNENIGSGRSEVFVSFKKRQHTLLFNLFWRLHVLKIMMNSKVSRTLDEKFPTFEALSKNLESEQETIKERNNEINETIAAEKAQALKNQQSAAADLQVYLKELKHKIHDKVPSDRDFNQLTDKISNSSQRKQEIIKKFKQLQQLTKGHQVIQRLQNIQKVENELQNCISSDNNNNNNNGKALNLYSSLLDDERVLGIFSKSSNPAVSSLASKGLQQFEKSIRNPLQENLKHDLRSILNECHWPKNTPKDDSKTSFGKIFSKLLQTERPKDMSSVRPQPLEAFAILAEQYDIRFKYHFEGKRDTNRLDKPEWAFEHFKSSIDEQMWFLEDYIQPILDSLENYQDRNALNEFITAMLPSLYKLLERNFPKVVDQPKLLSHLIYQTGQFDILLQSAEGGYCYFPYGRDQWKGLTGDILSKPNHFDQWLTVERENALSRYEELIESSNAFEIDFEAVDNHETKPTHSAINIRDLLEGVTDHYKTLASVSYRLRFLSDIQITILDKYHERLQESIAAFESKSSSLARSIGGISQEDLKRISGMDGLERLCRLYGSAEYTRASLDSWSQELFFLTLWDDICRLSAKNKKLDNQAQKSVENKPVHIPDTEEDEGTLFDEFIESFTNIRNRIFEMIKSLLKQELRTAMSDYFKSNDWKLESSPPSGISSKLNNPIKRLSKQLDFMRRFHSPNDYKKLAKSFSADLERYMRNYVIQANMFSKFGAQQLAKDVSELWSNLQLYQDASYRRLEQACILLCTENLPKDAVKIEQEFNLPDLTTDQILQIIDRRL